MNKPHGNSLRRGRTSEPGGIYSLTSVVRDRKPLLSDFALARLLIQQFRLAQNEQAAVSLAWVVMPDHFHWLVQLEHTTLATLMRRVKSRSGCAINKASGRQGPLWQAGFHDRAIRTEDDIESVARYIVMNPVRAGLVEKVGDYPHWDAVWL